MPLRDALTELWEARYLVQRLVVRELKVRYKNSALGFLWSIIPPLLQVLVFTFVFRGVLSVQAKNYSAYLLCGLIPWTFFQTAILDSSRSLIDNLALIKKVYLPREVIPLAHVISNFIHFLMAWLVYFVAFGLVARLFGYGIPVLTSWLWFPIITLLLMVLVTGISLWIATLCMFYDDIKFVLQTLFQLLYFVMPILYPADNVYYAGIMRQHPWLFRLYMLNPVTAIINAYRKTLLEPLSPSAFNSRLTLNGQEVPPIPMDWGALAIAALISLLILWSGYNFFNRKKWQFVEWS